MRSNSRPASLVALLAVLGLVACNDASTTHGGFGRTSTSEGSGLEKVNDLSWKAALDAAQPLTAVSRAVYVVREASLSAIGPDGKPASTTKLSDKATSPLTVVSGSAYYGSGKQVSAIQFPEGTGIWTSKVGAAVSTAPAVVSGHVVVTGQELIALDRETGEEKWSYAGEGKFRGTPAVKGSTIFVASTKGRVYAVDVGTGQPIWELETSSAFGVAPASVAGDMVVVPGRDGVVWGIFAETGRERWRFPTRGVISTGVALANDRAWVGTEAGDVSAINLRTGQEIWRMQDLPAVVTSPVWANGAVYVGCDDGKLVALNAEDGAHKWSFQLESEPLGAPLVGSGEMWMVDVGGRVYHVK